jgi:hypothetical protein
MAELDLYLETNLFYHPFDFTLKQRGILNQDASFIFSVAVLSADHPAHLGSGRFFPLG